MGAVPRLESSPSLGQTSPVADARHAITALKVGSPATQNLYAVLAELMGLIVLTGDFNLNYMYRHLYSHRHPLAE